MGFRFPPFHFTGCAMCMQSTHLRPFNVLTTVFFISGGILRHFGSPTLNSISKLIFPLFMVEEKCVVLAPRPKETGGVRPACRSPSLLCGARSGRDMGSGRGVTPGNQLSDNKKEGELERSERRSENRKEQTQQRASYLT